jgi:hypothetical protein
MFFLKTLHPDGIRTRVSCFQGGWDVHCVCQGWCAYSYVRDHKTIKNYLTGPQVAIMN